MSDTAESILPRGDVYGSKLSYFAAPPTSWRTRMIVLASGPRSGRAEICKFIVAGRTPQLKWEEWTAILIVSPTRSTSLIGLFWVLVYL